MSEASSQEADCTITFVRAGRVSLREPAHTPLASILRWRDTHYCSPVVAWLMAGHNRTNAEGLCRIDLHRLLCLHHDRESVLESYVPHLLDAPDFTVTPNSLQPVFATTYYRIQPSALDKAQSVVDPPSAIPQIVKAMVVVYTWQAGGEPAPEVEFSWQCTVLGARSCCLDRDSDAP
jgi:hypothetical protein